MVDRVHGDAAVVRATPEPARAAGLADAACWRARCCRPGRWWRGSRGGPADLARGQADLGPVAFLGHELRADAGRAARAAPPLPILQLDVVDRRAERDVAERQALPGLMSALRARDDACRRPSGRRARGCSASRRRRSAAARCAPCGSDRTRSLATVGRDADLVALEVDDAVALLVAAAAEARGDAAVVVAAARCDVCARSATSRARCPG